MAARRRTDRPSCPRCGQPARSVKRVTLESLLRPQCRQRIGDGSWYVCEQPDCTVAYFQPAGGVFEIEELTIPFGIKATHPPRPVCYCFNHTIEEIEDEVARTGRSTVIEQIRDAMKTEGCRCEQTNPLGRCCLATVQAAIDAASARLGTAEAASCDATVGCSCCDEPAEAQTPDAEIATRAGVVATVGSVTAAVLSSACCWLPLVAIAVGGSVAGVAAVFERWRIPLVLVAGLLLAAGFWFAYGPPARAAACCTPRSLRLRRGMVWFSTLLVVLAVVFPQLLVAATGGRSASTAALADQRVALELPVAGMTCEGCAAILRSKLAALPGVQQVEVSYAQRRARVVAAASVPREQLREKVIAAIREAGYDVP